MDLQERIEKAKHTLHETNCIGTALYLVGIKSQDHYVDPDTYSSSLISGDELEELDAPEESCLVVFGEDTRIYHMGIITKMDPLSITHRMSYRGKFLVDDSIVPSLEKYCNLGRFGIFSRVRYYGVKEVDTAKESTLTNFEELHLDNNQIDPKDPEASTTSEEK